MNHFAVTLTALTALTALSCSAPGGDPAQRAERDFYLGGIQIHEESLDGWFDGLEQHGLNTVHITDYAVQGEWDSDDLRFEAGKPWLVDEIRAAKRRGLSVALVLRVHLDDELERNAFLWHGMIVPKTDSLLRSWFTKYTRYCLEWARIAEAEGVDVLFFASEMNALASTRPADHVPQLEEYFLNDQKQQERRENIEAQRQMIEESETSFAAKKRIDDVENYLDTRIRNEQEWARTVVGDAQDASVLNRRREQLQGHWGELTGALRGVYSGPLGYAANFDQFHDVGFWPQVDVMGINAYFPLRNQLFDAFNAEALYPLLLDGWRQALHQLDAFRAANGLGLPVIFTELGYTWRRRSTLKPWEHEGFSVIYGDSDDQRRVVVWQDQPRELRERALAIRALRQAHGELETPFLRGILYWKLSSHDYHEADEPYVIHIGKSSRDPALAELRAFVG
ncbi:MAG: hypothetical protein AAGM22_01615 [Acidobacteriota bacterium]